VLEVSLRGPCGSGGVRAGGGGSGRRAGEWAATAGRGVYAAGAVGADVGQSESGRVGRGRGRDRVPPIYDGV
jgi:hypothetical protein